MKKLSFIVTPLMALSLLASCGGNGASQATTHKFTFTGGCCKINDSYTFSHDIYEGDEYVQYTVVADNEYSLPETIEGDVTYSRTSKKIAIISVIRIKSDININITANPDPTPAETFTVAFDANGGELTKDTVNPLSVESSKTIPLDKAPKLNDRPGYDKNAVTWVNLKTKEEFKFGDDGTPVTDNLVLQANWQPIAKYVVHFKSTIDDSTISPDQTIDYGSKVQRPATKAITGYNFDNWYDSDKKTLFDFETPLTSGSTEFTIYAKYTIKECNITYITNGGTLGTTHTDKVNYGGTIITPPDITRSGYDEKDVTWWLDQEMTTNPFTFGEKGTGTDVTGDINLYAKWDEESRSFDVKWLDYDGTVLKTESCKKGTTPVYVDKDHPTPTRESDPYHDYPFNGWLPEPAAINSNMTYVATYNEVHYDAQVYMKVNIANDNQTFKFSSVSGADNFVITYGDGSDPTKETSHTYAKKGEYYIRIANYVSNFAIDSSSSASIETVQLGLGITSIGNNAFKGCTNLTSISIPTNVTSIGASAFSGCSHLASVSVPDKVTSIGNDAFSGCADLTSINIPDAVTSIGNNAFKGCAKLTSIIISANVTSIGEKAFSDCSTLKIYCKAESKPTGWDETWNDSNRPVYWGYLSTGSTSSGLNYVVQQIGGQKKIAISNYDGTDTAITIPNNIEVDGETLPVTSIGAETFSNCSSLTSIGIPGSVTSIGHHAFYNCSELTTVNIPSGVTSIPDCTFSNCSKLANISIPDSVTTIGDNAFSSSGITSITIPNTVTTIGKSAFLSCRSLGGTVTIPASVTSLGEGAFYRSTLETVTFGANSQLKSIPKEAFADCGWLTSVTLPDGLETIDSNAFKSSTGLTAIIIPNSVTEIKDEAFCLCSNLDSVTLSNSLTRIGYQAFNGCKLDSIVIPGSVTSIGGKAFGSCMNLKTVDLTRLTTPPTAGANIFDSVPRANLKLYVTSNTISDFKTAYNWDTYADYFTDDPLPSTLI